MIFVRFIMKTGKFLTYCASIALCSFVPHLAADAVYLKADAAGAQTGTSWDDAYTSVAAAVAAADGRPIWAAQGLYLFDSPVSSTTNIVIYGGFEGRSMAETLDSRNTDLFQTIFSGDVENNDVWQHRNPCPGEYRYIETTLPLLVTTNGLFNRPPPFVGAYDAYVPLIRKVSVANTPNALRISANTSLCADGIWFVGFSGEGCAIRFETRALASTIRDCRFTGLYANGGSILDNTAEPVEIVDCDFFYITDSRAGGVATRGNTTIRNCSFKSIARSGGSCANVIFFWSGNKPNHVIDSVFTRCVDTGGDETGYGSKGAVFADEQTVGAGGGFIENCVITNCMSFSKGEYGIPILSGGQISFKGCLVANNHMEVTAHEGHVYPLVGAVNRSLQDFTINSCVFASNVVSATDVAAQNGKYALGMISLPGCLIKTYTTKADTRVALLNTSFDGNRVFCEEKTGVEAVKCRGLVATSTLCGGKVQTGVANCTFTGPSLTSVYDIAQFGEAHSYETIVLNSIFMTDGEIAAPFYVTKPELFSVRNSIIKNFIRQPCSPKCLDCSGDAIPLARGQDGHLEPIARTPEIRHTADIFTNLLDSTGFVTYSYRLPDETEILPLLPLKPVNVPSDLSPICDARGLARPLGGGTSGAIQTLPTEAEEGFTLLIRREPVIGGTLGSPGSVQSVVPGGTSEAVEVSAAQGFTFAGWFREGEITPFSSASSLPEFSLTNDLIVIAKFVSPQVTVTFDLGECGLFECGSSVTSIVSSAGSPFPALPPYAPSAEFVLEKWSPPFSALTPFVDTVYSAQGLAAAPRVFHIVPEDDPVLATSDGSGSSWENATSDIVAALADAARWRGELWFKKGLYKNAHGLTMRSNVAIIGGFSGEESVSSEADSVANPVIFDGDKNGDNYWFTNGLAPPVEERIPVRNEFTFNLPPYTDGGVYWQPSGAISEDSYDPAFDDTQTGITNFITRGITFSGYRGSVFIIGAGSEVEIDNCRFIACQTSNSSYWYTIYSLGVLKLTNTQITGCNYPLYMRGDCKPNLTNIIENCSFEKNVVGALATLCCDTSDRNIIVRDTRICGNTFLQSASGAIYINASRAQTALLEGCLISNNWASSHGYCGVKLFRTDVSRLRMFDNTAEVFDVSNNNFFLHCVGLNPNLDCLISDSIFKGNRIFGSRAVASTANQIFASAVAVTDSRPTFLNCTFESNRVSAPVEERNTAGTFVVMAHNNNQSLALVNCAVSENDISGGDNSAEIVFCGGNSGFSGGNSDTTCAIINSIVQNKSTNYRPLSLPQVISPCITHSYVAKLDVEALTIGENGYLYELYDKPPIFSANLRVGTNGAMARGISGSSRYAAAGRPVWLGIDSYWKSPTIFFYDEIANPQKPWRQARYKNWFGASAPGLDVNSPIASDAFGESREWRRIALGPLNAPYGATLFILK